MPFDQTTLKRSIAQLGKRWEELRKRSIMATSSDETLEILDQMELVNIQITRLDTQRAHLEATAVTIKPPSDDDRKRLSDSLTVLSKEISKAMKWRQAYQLIRNILIAARDVQTNIAGRTG